MSYPAISAQDIASVAALTLHHPSHASIATAQTRHRFDLIARWNIPAGSRVLELGCGQGDCTAALAHIVGPSGHVTAVDPGPIDTYGSPYTLAQAQAHLSKGPLGSRITWVEADPIAYLKSCPGTQYDFAVLAHCIWYFPLPTTLGDILRALVPHATRIAIAEWSLTASSPAGMPHILAAFAQASLHPHLKSSSSNIRTIIAPSAIKTAATQLQLSLLAEGLVTPNPQLQDCKWEMVEVKSQHFQEEINSNVESEKERAVMYALRDAALDSAAALKARGEEVQCMDVWTAVFNAKPTS